SGLYCRPVGAERILVSSSGMTALMLTAQALIDEGDNLVIVAPVWPNISAAAPVARNLAAGAAGRGGEPRLVSLDRQPGGGWHLDLERLFAACDSRTRRDFRNSPANPPGVDPSAQAVWGVLRL